MVGEQRSPKEIPHSQGQFKFRYFVSSWRVEEWIHTFPLPIDLPAAARCRVSNVLENVGSDSTRFQQFGDRMDSELKGFWAISTIYIYQSPIYPQVIYNNSWKDF